MEIPAEEIVRYLRLGGRRPEAALEERIRVLRADVTPHLAPRRLFARFPRSRFAWGGDALARHLEGCGDVYLLVATLGAAFDVFLRRTSAVSAADAFIVQAIGAAAVERVLDDAETEIRAGLAPDETLVSRYSPGYGDFPLEESRAILGALDASKRIGVSLTESLLLVPSKSVTAVIGVRQSQNR